MRGHWISMSWTTNIATAELVTVETEIAFRHAGLPSLDDFVAFREAGVQGDWRPRRNSIALRGLEPAAYTLPT